MALYRYFLAIFFFLFNWMGLAYSTSFMSDVPFDSLGSTRRSLLQAQKHVLFDSLGSTHRRLLQAKTPCPIDFEHKNYTVITSQCSGPSAPPVPCCNAFKTFACPYADQLNDLTTDCATNMFSYLSLNGSYTGLFSSWCRDGKEGLSCPASAPQSENNNSDGVEMDRALSLLLTLVAGLAFLLQIF